MKRVVITVISISVMLVQLGLGQEAKLKIDGQLEGFSLPDVRSGRTVSLSDFESSKAVVLIFISTGCPYSNAFNVVMADLSKRYGTRGAVFIGINSNKTEPARDVKKHAEENGLEFTVVKDGDSSFANQLGAQVTPEVFLLDKDGKLRYHGALGNSRQPTTKVAEANGDELVQALESVLNGDHVAMPQTKMFGCTIKR
ncbi:MAG TPA: redoxin family protein [Acidobacteriota bacterium]|nr:redoxin family protein [Acidobacteriota bacterium]